MDRFLHRLRNQPLSQQLALSAAGCCLLATLTLVMVSVQSTQSIQNTTLTEHAEAAVVQLAERAATELSAGDRLGLIAELQFYTDQSLFAAARVLDIEGIDLAMRGQISAHSAPFQQPVMIDGNTAGWVELYLDLSEQRAARQTLMWGLIGLAGLLSIAVYSVTRPMGQRLASNISAAVAQLDAVTSEASASINEVHKLQDRINALPLDLLKSSVAVAGGDDHYTDTAILCISLKHLPGYLDTLDEARLQRYVSTLHRMAYGCAGFYGGNLSVVRQFTLAIYFSGSHAAGSPVFRAASCAWLLSRISDIAGQRDRLSFTSGMAVGISELGHGDDKDIYPGLYVQSTLDDLLHLANQPVEGVLLSSHAAEDTGLTGRIGIDVIDEKWMALGEISGAHLDLLERQLGLMSRLITPADDETPQGILPF